MFQRACQCGIQRLAGWLLVLVLGLMHEVVAAAEDSCAKETVDAARLMQLVRGAECVGVSVDLQGQVLWAGASRHLFFLQVASNVLRIRMDLSEQRDLKAGDTIRLSGFGMAGQGVLDEWLNDNDGLHGATRKSGTIHLSKGMHAFRADWFNGRADAILELEYSGPQVSRQPVPSTAFYRRNPSGAENAREPGLNYRCFQGTWEQLPDWRDWQPVKTGVVPNLDVTVRSQNENVGLEFTGYLKADEPGDYTFWSRSDDGSRLFVGDSRLHLEKTGSAPLPAPREVKPGQPLAESEDCFWAVMEGIVTGLHTDLGGNVALELSGPEGRAIVESAGNVNIQVPGLFSRCRATGLCRTVRAAGGKPVAGRLMTPNLSLIEQLAPTAPSVPAVCSVGRLRELAASGHRTGANLCLTGIVMSAISPGGFFAFQDDSGGVVVQMDLADGSLAAGERIVLRGTGALDRNYLHMTQSALVENDGLHVRRERDGAMNLRKGRTPVHLSWFHRIRQFALEIYYQGPGVTRQRIPATALVHPEVDTNQSIKWVPGLNCVAYRGDWESLPKTSELDPAEMSAVGNFDPQAAGATDKLDLEFTGFLEVPRDGQYVFTVTSSDGAMLFLDEQAASIQRLGRATPPSPLAIVPRQVLDRDQNYRWAEVEGTVNFAFDRGEGLVFELGSDYGPMKVEVADAAGGSPLLLLGSQVKLRGICESGLVSGGHDIAANFVVPSMQQIEITRVAAAQWKRYPLQTIGSLTNLPVSARGERIVRFRGEATATDSQNSVRLTDASGGIIVRTAQPLQTNWTGTLEVLGRVIRSETNTTLSSALVRNSPEDAEAKSTGLPVLTKILPIKQLTREQAQLGLPVKIRGVITLIRGSDTGFILQDDTSAIDVWWTPHSNKSLPRVGDYWEVEGNTFAEFSPNVRAKRAVRLGSGVMPEPLRPDWDQLLNGSLDTRYVELQGIVIGITSNGVLLFTRAGKINVQLFPLPGEPLTRYQDCLVRIRGCVVPIRNATSQQVEVGQTRLSNVSLEIDEPAPEDPFNTVMKHPSELLQFDARVGSLQRVKIAGQVLHARGGELFVADGTNSFKAMLQTAAPVNAGDLVEVAGFPELGGPSPILREALLRRTGSAPLPSPRPLSGEAATNTQPDGALVSIEARLIGVSGGRLQRVLELQGENRDFLARVEDPDDTLAGLVKGSLLRLTGVYAEERGRASDQKSTSFELLLNSPANVTVLQRPPWWTPRRILMAAGVMILVILAGACWIVLLHKRVEEAAAKLADEVRRRERIQQQNVLEQERTRIAKDMHDQLGTSVTQVGLLAELTKKELGNTGKAAAHADQICRRAIELGRTLDEIVWAVNPKNDSLDKFCDYMAVHAQELFQFTEVLCRVDLPPELPGIPLATDIRHNLFLATQEALNNIVRHASAREVWIRFKLEGRNFQITIVDDGRGFSPEKKRSLRNGLTNMEKRLEDIGGRFAISSQSGRGTEVSLVIPLALPAEVP